MEMQYENWSKVLIEPQAVNVAQLHSLQQRMDAFDKLNSLDQN